MVRPADVGVQVALLASMLLASVPWALEGRPDEVLVWSFLVVPPLVLAGAVAVRERVAS